jgi:hypothetical protein
LPGIWKSVVHAGRSALSAHSCVAWHVACSPLTTTMMMCPLWRATSRPSATRNGAIERVPRTRKTSQLRRFAPVGWPRSCAGCVGPSLSVLLLCVCSEMVHRVSFRSNSSSGGPLPPPPHIPHPTPPPFVEPARSMHTASPAHHHAPRLFEGAEGSEAFFSETGESIFSQTSPQRPVPVHLSPHTLPPSMGRPRPVGPSLGAVAANEGRRGGCVPALACRTLPPPRPLCFLEASTVSLKPLPVFTFTTPPPRKPTQTLHTASKSKGRDEGRDDRALPQPCAACRALPPSC